MISNPRRVALLGSNSGRNAGDAALLETVIDQITSRRPETVFEVPTTHPKFIRKHFKGKNVIPVPILPWNMSIRLLGLPVLLSLKRCDLSLIMDGIIFDHRLFNPAFNFLITLVFLAPYSRLVARPMVCFEVGIGPLKTYFGRKFARIVCDACDSILVRENDSSRLLKEVGVSRTPIKIYADAAFISRPAPEARVDNIIKDLDIGGRPMVGLNLTRYGGEWIGKGRKFDKRAFQSKIAGIIDQFTCKTKTVIVLTATQHMDRDYLEEVKSMVKEQNNVRLIANIEHTPGELTGLMGRMEMFIGMRLHSLILASSAKTPILGLTYAPKVRSLFEMIERPELALDLSNLEEDHLVKTIDNFWEKRKDEKIRIEPFIDKFKELASAGFDTLVQKYF